MSFSSILQYFSSFVPGSRLVDGGDCLNLVKLQISAVNGITALAGGGQVGATPLTAYLNEVTGAGAGGTDSVMLPLGLPGLEVTVINDSGQSIQVFGQTLNPNTGLGDTIAPHNSIVQTASATGVTLANAASAVYSCFAPGKWKQQLNT
jgi:hypothetical protein